ncbi:sulfurtransferase complex subunit TusC [Buchnera aphidicola (Mollitrichosiphum nigrofasciatum)]|uniref:sulfurtransferase complex subunit TusC n=1 Tax=Buchnera aphidicola TaxID=9 RepID=UPI0031B827BA
MNKSIAFVFSYAPHGSSIGREGLDAILSISNCTREISLFFIDDGVFQLIDNQKSKYILLKNYVAAFKILSLYDINNIYYCLDSMQKRGLNSNVNFVIPVIILNTVFLKEKLTSYDYILNF